MAEQENITVEKANLWRALRWLAAVIGFCTTVTQTAWRVYSQQQQMMQQMSEKLSLGQMRLDETQRILRELQMHKAEEHGEIRGQIRSLQEQINAHLSGQRR